MLIAGKVMVCPIEPVQNLIYLLPNLLFFYFFFWSSFCSSTKWIINAIFDWYFGRCNLSLILLTWRWIWGFKLRCGKLQTNVIDVVVIAVTILLLRKFQKPWCYVCQQFKTIFETYNLCGLFFEKAIVRMI